MKNFQLLSALILLTPLIYTTSFAMNCDELRAMPKEELKNMYFEKDDEFGKTMIDLQTMQINELDSARAALKEAENLHDEEEIKNKKAYIASLVNYSAPIFKDLQKASMEAFKDKQTILHLRAFNVCDLEA